MSLHHIANHLASKGRNGDTTLVHMTKGEVAGLQALAKAHGTSLTKNPDTGLPEAFGLKQLLPMAAGAALTPFVGPMGAAAIVGGLGYLQSGSLTQGLMAGMGAYGGAGLGEMAGLGAAGTQPVAGEIIAGAAPEASLVTPPVSPPITTGVEGMPVATTPFQASPAGADALKYTGLPDVSTMTAQTGYVPPQGSPINGLTETNVQAVGPVAPTYSAPVSTPPPAAPGIGETFMKNASADKMQAARYGLAAAAPIIGDAMTPKQYTPPEIKSDSDMGQRYAYNPGYDNSIPGRTGPASYTKISDEEAKKLYGYAEGGEVQYPVGEPVMRMADGGETSVTPSNSQAGGWVGGAVGSGGKAVHDLIRDLQAQGIRLGAPQRQSSAEEQVYTPSVTGYGSYTPQDAYVAARGLGLGIDYSGYDTMPNQGIAAVVNRGNPNQNIVALYKAAEAKKAAEEAKTAEEKRIAEESAASSFSDVGYQLAAGGGISTLGGYSDGGRLLKGPGDGMSDNIPAKIGEKQPARLADGEFVVPADVVSHLGNGSTDAGAKQLYKMMDKVRTARTGRKAQGKQINPNKLMPA